jgi:Ni,Fe-hydrogenase I large subunit
MKTISLNPVSRIEGHLAVHTDTEPVTLNGTTSHRVISARCVGEMFRGLEKILEGRDPLDAQVIMQRVCGVCPIAHGMGSVKAQEKAYGIVPTPNGRLLQNLIAGANYLHSHILHFYQLAALDFVDVKALLKYHGNSPTLNRLKAWVEDGLTRKDAFPGAPFLPRYEVKYIDDLDTNLTLLAHYTEALEIRKIGDEMGAIFGAKLPHATALIPGGCTQKPTIDHIMSYGSRLKRVAAFIRDVYWPDVLSVGKAFSSYFDIGQGSGNFLAFGAFELDETGRKWIRPGALLNGKWETLDQMAITEDATSSKFAQSRALHPSLGETEAQPAKPGAYTWIKSPRYRGQAVEVGPLARWMVNYHDSGQPWVKQEVDTILGTLNQPLTKMVSVMGRHVVRAMEARALATQMAEWLAQIEIDGAPYQPFQIPKSGSGYGLTEAPRGALGHWLTIENHRIQRYQCIVPTTWNCSPRDASGLPGPVEQALVGLMVEDPAQPIEVGRVVRSFDPCIACAVH